MPLYPGFARKPRNHTLALDDGRSMITSRGQVLPCGTYQEWLDSASSNALDVRVDSVIGWRFFPQAIDDERATVHAARSRLDSHPHVASITWRVGKKHCTLFPASNWGDSATLESLDVHQATLDYLDVGVYASPSSLGQATMERQIERKPDGRLKGYNVPARVVARDVRDNLVGGRIETYQAGTFDSIHEVDRNSAYLDEAGQSLPNGKAISLYAPSPGELRAFPHYYAQCVVYVTRPLILGPFPFRDRSTGQVSYPTQPGTYENAWLWRGEVLDSLEVGCQIVIRRAWAWTRSEPALRKWSAWIYERRGPSAPSDHVRTYVKRLALAAIGWHGMGSDHLIVKRGTGSPDAVPIVGRNGMPTIYVTETIPECKPRQLGHWASYIYSEARRSLYAREVAEIKNGNLVLTCDTDSLKLLYPSSLPTSMIDLGAWKARTLTNVRQSTGRAYYCDQKIIVPGLADPEARDKWRQSLDRWLLERAEADALDALYKLEHPIEVAIERAQKMKNWQPASGFVKTKPAP